MPLEPGRAHAHGAGQRRPLGPGERRPLGRAAPARAKMEMEEPTPRFFSDIFPENHADLSCHGFLTGKILVIFPELG